MGNFLSWYDCSYKSSTVDLSPPTTVTIAVRDITQGDIEMIAKKSRYKNVTSVTPDGGTKKYYDFSGDYFLLDDLLAKLTLFQNKYLMEIAENTMGLTYDNIAYIKFDSKANIIDANISDNLKRRVLRLLENNIRIKSSYSRKQG